MAASAVTGPLLAAYPAVLLADTAVPTGTRRTASFDAVRWRE
jgi:hypothetical protein